jgi:streptogramin lyase
MHASQGLDASTDSIPACGRNAASMERFQRSGSAALTLDGSIWYIAPYTRNLFRYDPETHETRRLTEADGLGGDAVFAVYKDRMGTVWVSTT